MSTKLITERMKYTQFMLKLKGLFLLVVLILFIILISSCKTDQSNSFGIYLADTGAGVLSDTDIQTYYGNMHTFELNAQGIQKWNSYINYGDVPKLTDGSLFGKDFVLKIEENEVCTGKFWSSASSSRFSGTLIFDSSIKLDSTHNMLFITSGYSNTGPYLETTLSSKLNEYFKKHNKLNLVE